MNLKTVNKFKFTVRIYVLKLIFIDWIDAVYIIFSIE